ncbi:hypothetical protein MAPG_08669 [Magnaporthiopsis poae ATCC 64411]|uniref:Uncharacterized protein n=1 Tax=Magnaporthiopsis poae (strain ATCC 64411 / 73-15) TaxID=644358 RepID=A0A0C4E7Y7_MAGP6|nr:hypothetical protein MAPG_08669 [Magnaporthiopsis poae ATCC 64411]
MGKGPGGKAPPLGIRYDEPQELGSAGYPSQPIYLEGSYSGIIQVSKDISKENMVELAHRAYREMMTIYRNKDTAIRFERKPVDPSNAMVAMEAGDGKIAFASSYQVKVPSGNPELIDSVAHRIARLGADVPNSVGDWATKRLKEDVKPKHRLNGKCGEFNVLRLDSERQPVDKRNTQVRLDTTLL